MMQLSVFLLIRCSSFLVDSTEKLVLTFVNFYFYFVLCKYPEVTHMMGFKYMYIYTYCKIKVRLGAKQNETSFLEVRQPPEQSTQSSQSGVTCTLNV